MKKETKEEKVCPNCGYCPTCKRPKHLTSGTVSLAAVNNYAGFDYEETDGPSN